MKKAEEIYIEFAREKIKILSSFDTYAKLLYESLLRVLSRYGIRGEVYFFGSVIEGKYTVSSDIDVAIVTEQRLKAGLQAEIQDEVIKEMEKFGYPWWFPLELHFLSPQLFEAMKKGGANFVKAEEYLEKIEMIM
ncbi:nucleotidyltransferase domain-containing protein [Sulfurisphaera javensis]|uniref:Nucleotidyltransferase domain-containing protein n=1 Tax=Sulfurisphaera javensis TaxID=2049879 RepID=A0AAT9GTN8_9CREN